MVRGASVVEDIFHAALLAVDPFTAVERNLEHVRAFFRAGSFKKLMVIGFGKASCPMARACEQYLDDRIDIGAVVTKFGHSRVAGPLNKVRVYEAAHPLPDENGVAATQEIIKLAREADEGTLIVCLISGGGSALLVAPQEITLQEKQRITDLLLKSGATITEVNAVRKHLSKIKGGRLAQIAYPAHIVSLIMSDVIGDRLDVIASGPTSPDQSTYGDALEVIEKYRLIGSAPASVLRVLGNGKAGLLAETPKKGNPVFQRVENSVIANNRLALQAAKQRAEALGFRAEIFPDPIQGEARNAARRLAQSVSPSDLPRPFCLISGGETTVTVKGAGLGGRNMELALAFAKEIEGMSGITFLSAGTDGTDGPTDAAGAVVEGHTAGRARDLGLDAKAYLDNNDSYTFFQKTGDLLVTGPTGTNVMDIQIIIGV
jgi:glycerate 2-kinase